MFGLRRVFYKAPTLGRLHAIRKFSSNVSLYRNVATALHIPANEIMHNLHETHAITERNEAKFEEYNKGAIAEYDAMIQNRIDAILGRGSISDWELAEDNGFLRKTFNFSSPDNAHYFVNEVSRVCSKEDHHPEWRMIGDKTIEVYLTSHFAGNKVSINDYELAEAMNKIEGSSKTYNQYNFFSKDRIIELTIGFIIFAIYMKGFGTDFELVDANENNTKLTQLKEVVPETDVDEQLDNYSLAAIKENIYR